MSLFPLMVYDATMLLSHKIMLTLLLMSGCLLRLTMLFFPSLSGITAMGAIAIISGMYCARLQQAIAFSLLTLFISDCLIQMFFYHGEFGYLLYPGWYFGYCGFLCIIFCGRYLKNNCDTVSLCAGVVTGCLFHWLISNLGVWLLHGLDVSTGLSYSFDVSGLMHCYYLALPFLKSFLLSTLFFAFVLYHSFEWVEAKSRTAICNVNI